MIYEIITNFYPAGSRVNSEKWTDVVFKGKKYNDIKMQLEDNRVRYVVSGPTCAAVIFKPQSSTDRNFNIIVEIIFTKLLDLKLNEPQTEDFVQNYTKAEISIYGHCMIGARLNSSFVEPLKEKIRKVEGLSKKVDFKVIISDPAEPLLKSKGKAIFEDLGKKEKDEIQETNIIFYSSGGAFFPHGLGRKRTSLSRLVTIDPKLILSTQTIVIILGDHNDIGDISHQYLDKDLNEIHNGVFLISPSAYGKNRYITKQTEITKESLNDAINKIYAYTKGQEKYRIKILTNVISVKLRIPTEELIEYLPEYDKEIEKTVKKIMKSITLKSAFNHVFNLFKPKGLFFGFVHEYGDFCNSLQSAYKAVVGIKNNNYEQAIEILTYEVEQTNRPYKRKICLALLNRINLWYAN